MIIAAIANVYKLDCQNAVHEPGDDYKLALYTSNADLNATTAVYSATNEVAGPGYTPGGKILTGRVTGLTNGRGWVSFADPVWPNSAIAARGGLIYNASKGDAALAVIDFEATISSTAGGPFTVLFPATGATAAIRIG